MRETTPEVFLIARPALDTEGISQYLQRVGGLEWWEKTSDHRYPGQTLAEFMGRLCYRSWKPGLNKNVTKVRTDAAEYLENILRSGHGSVLEHGTYSFVFRNVSRVFTHELVRHRAGTAMSQESLRYVRLDELNVRIPHILDPVKEQFIDLVEKLEDFQKSAAEQFGLDQAGIPFHYKKEVTSALRRLAPEGVSTDLGWSANIRTIRHVIAARTAPGAEEEIRFVFHLVMCIMRQEAPYLFNDFTRELETGAWVPKYQKV